MQIQDLNLTNYRNHKGLEIIFDPKTTLIIGPNGIGKTNLLEALHLLSTTKAYRAQYDRDTIHHEEDFTRLESNIQTPDNETNLIITIQKSPNFDNASTKKVQVNKLAKNLSTFTTKLNTVLFSPEDIEVITNSPSKRRKYIDSILIQTHPKYKKTLAQYTKAVRQRNKILELIRNEGRGHKQLEFWDDEILEKGQEIQKDRTNLFKSLNKKILKHGKQLNGKAKLETKYKMSELTPEKLAEVKEKEIMAKSTLVGPHRDDSVSYTHLTLPTN